MVFSILGLKKLKIDDPVGAISVHGTAGIWGVMAVLLSNEDATLSGQRIGLGCIFGFVFAASLVTWMILKIAMGMRVSADEELEGVDLSECGIPAYPEFVSAGMVGGGSSGSPRAMEAAIGLTASKSTA